MKIEDQATMTVSSNDWSLTIATGGKPSFLPHSSASASILSKDGRYSIVILAYQVRVYFISTRQCIRSIDVDLEDLVDVKLDPSNPSTILLFKSYGEVITLNWKDKVTRPIESKVDLELEAPLLSVISVNDKSYYMVLGKKNKKLAPQTRYIQVIARTEDQKNQTLAEIDNSIAFSTSLDSSKVVFVTSNHEVILYDLIKHFQDAEVEVESETLKFPFKSSITSLAVSNDSVIAIGTSAGAIQILYGGLETEKPQRLLKWHIDQVRSLQFSQDNNYLLSGGLEKVLVFWQLDTDKTQFLPRLNGSIEKISVDNNMYTLLLNISSTKSEFVADENHEVLVLSAVDLVSRLSVNAPRPNFSNQLKSSLTKTKKKFLKSETTFDKSKLRYDYSSLFEIHPKTKHAYFPADSSIQAYDMVKNEQQFVQNIAPVLSIGKVRSETKLVDPVISLISFTQDGEWMCTFDSVSTSEIDNLLSKDDTQYALKFWKFIETKADKDVKSGHWELTTKIIDPHGNSNPILSVVQAPSSYHNGLAFLTADNKGGLRVWRPRIPKEIYQSVKNGSKLQQTAWTLRKSRPSGALSSDAVDICWSNDSSIVLLGHECSIIAINAQTFEEIPNDMFKIPSISGSRIRSLSILDDNLIVLSKTRISSFNLLNGELNDLVAKVNTTTGGKNLVTIDPLNKLIALAVNYYDTSDHFKVCSKILIFKPHQLKPIHVQYHNQGISSIRYFNSSFIFVDLDSRIGMVQSSSTNVHEDVGLTAGINSMLLNAQATADVINNRNITTKTNSQQASTDVDDSEDVRRVLDLHTFQPVFENTDGVQLDTLFDRILKVIR